MKIQYALSGVAIAASLAALPSLTLAATVNAALAGINTAEMPRVTQSVNNNVVSKLSNTHVAALSRMKLASAVDDTLPMPHMQLILKPSASRASALQTLIAAQHDASSPKFHQWITPAEFGSTFGVADADVNAV